MPRIVGGTKWYLLRPAQFGEFGEVGDVVGASVVVAVGDDPADVGPEEAESVGE